MPKQTFFNLPEEKRRRIINTLIEYFANKPYSKVDIEDIAKECKVAKGSMYQYFENKKDMYFYAINEAIRLSLELVKDYNFENISLFDYVERSFDLAWGFFLKYPNAYLLLEKSAFYDDSPYKDEVQRLLKDRTQKILYEIITKNQRAGFIRDDVSPEVILVFLEGATWSIKRFFI
ncbi:TetR/AcrR family transcriptional regulator, partial [bacterium]|nr:TetR/AcrR family transcriptional regulator [bacterium]